MLKTLAQSDRDQVQVWLENCAEARQNYAFQCIHKFDFYVLQPS